MKQFSTLWRRKWGWRRVPGKVKPLRAPYLVRTRRAPNGGNPFTSVNRKLVMKKHKRLTILVLLVAIFSFILLIVVIIQKSPLYLYAKLINTWMSNKQAGLTATPYFFCKNCSTFILFSCLTLWNARWKPIKKINSKSPLRLVIYVKLKVPGSSANGFSWANCSRWEIQSSPII